MTVKSNETEVRTTEREIVISRVFDAPRELVWEAMTDPKKVVNWWGPRGFSTKIEEMDVRPGGVWKHVMAGPDGTKYPNQSIFKEVTPPERIVFAHGGRREDGPEILKEMTWTFETVGEGRTRLTLRQVYPSAEVLERIVKEFGAIEGGKQTLQRLAEEVEKREEEFVISRVFDAPRELVWQMWTDAEHLSRWWGPKGCEVSDCKLDLRHGGAFLYRMKGQNGFEMWGKFTYREINKPERMVFVSSFSDPNGGTTRHPMSATWPLETLNILTLSESGGKTSITLRAFPVNASDEERKSFKEGRAGMQYGMSATLDHLAEHLATPKRGKQTMNIVKNTLSKDFTSGELLITRTFDAPRSLVFKAWTDPAQVAQWWGPAGFTNPVCEVDARPGGTMRIHMRAPDGTVYPMTAVFREVAEPERIVFVSGAHADEGEKPIFEVLTTVTFEEKGGKTTVAMSARPFNLTPGAEQYLSGMEQGWGQSLDRLADFVTKT